MPEHSLEYWKAQTKAQLDINSDWRKRCQKLEKELAEAKQDTKDAEASAAREESRADFMKAERDRYKAAHAELIEAAEALMAAKTPLEAVGKGEALDMVMARQREALQGEGG